MILPPAPTTSPAPMLRPQRGAGTRITDFGALGFSVSADRGGASFGHPWKPFLGGLRLQFNLGLVTAGAVVVPTIKAGGKRVALNATPAPALVLNPSLVNGNGESYAVLEVVPDAQGNLTKDSRVEIVQSDSSAPSLDPALGKKVIALILWRERQPVRVFPLVHFHLEYQRVIPTAGGGAVRHYFR